MTFLGMDQAGWFGVLLGAAAISWCVILIRRIYNRRIRMLTVLLSVLGLCQAVRVADRYHAFNLQLPSGLAQGIDVMMGVCALVAIAVLHLHNTEQRSASMRLRLAEAERAEATPDSEPLLPPNTRLTHAVKMAPGKT